MRAGRRVVITGAGCCTSLGHTPQSIVQALKTERAAFAPAGPRFSCPEQAVCPTRDMGDDAASARFQSWRRRRYLSRGAAFAVLSGLRAAQSAGFCDALPPETGLISAAGPTLDIEEAFPRPLERLDHPNLDALWLLRWLPNTAAAALARFMGVHGECLVVGTACAASLHALGEAYRRVRFGLAERVLVIAGDSRISSGGVLGYARAGVLSRARAPLDAVRPFDAKRDGFAPGEGGAAFVLETLDAAQARRAAIFAEVLGFGASLDAGALTAPDPQARFAEKAVRAALDDAGLTPGDIGWVSAHGTGTVLNDACESLLLERVFADNGVRPVVAALKSWLGHGAAACGAMELAVMLAAARDGFIPRIRNLDHPCSLRLNFAREHRPFPEQRAGLLENFGFGGQNAALAVRPWPAETQSQSAPASEKRNRHAARAL